MCVNPLQLVVCCFFFLIYHRVLYIVQELLFSCSVVSDYLLPHRLQHARRPILYHLTELAQFHVHWVGDAIQQSLPLFPLLFLPSIFPRIRIFSNESALYVRWPKYWSFSIIPSYEYSGLISFRFDWFDLLAVQRTLKSFLQHHSSKTSILQHFLYGLTLTSI